MRYVAKMVFGSDVPRDQIEQVLDQQAVKLQSALEVLGAAHGASPDDHHALRYELEPTR